MDRQTALERLDAVRPGSDDLSDPEMAGLSDALAGDNDLRAEFDRRRNWDRGIASAVRDVPVPEGLKGRLLTRLAAAETVIPPRPVSRSRRRVLASLSAAAAALMAGAIYWTIAGSHEPVTIAEARDAAAEVLMGRGDDVPFNGDVDPKVPTGWETRFGIGSPVLGLLADSGEHRAAAWRVRSTRGAHWQAVLVAIPVDDVVSPSTAASISDRDYVPGGNVSGVQTVSWTQGGFVYVCCTNNLDALIGELDAPVVA
jgi:hypothetical protein